LFELLVAHCLRLPDKLKNKTADVTAAPGAAAQFYPKATISSCTQLTPAGPSGVVQLLEWELSINDKAHELLVAVMLLLKCWSVRAKGSCRALRFWGGPPAPSSGSSSSFRLSRARATPIMRLG